MAVIVTYCTSIPIAAANCVSKPAFTVTDCNSSVVMFAVDGMVKETCALIDD